MNSRSQADLTQLLAEREWLQRLARGLLGDGPDADDLAQETVVRAIDSGLPRVLTRGWLATIARNLKAERHRAELHRQARERSSARPEREDPAESLERAAFQRELLDAVLKLPDPGRTAVVLRFLDGLSYEEVAARQDCSVQAVRKRVSRALQELRSQLDEGRGSRGAWAGLLLPYLSGVDLALPPWTPLAGSSNWIQGGIWMSSKAKLCLVAATLGLVVIGVLSRFDLQPDRATGLERDQSARATREASELVAIQGETESRESLVEDSGLDLEEAEADLLFAFPPRPHEQVGSLELRLLWSDGSPAAGVHARVMPWGASDAFLHERSVLTDHRGVGVLEQLAPGGVGLYLDRCGAGTAEILAGTTTIHEFKLPQGVTIRGRVLSPSGEAVPGAILCLSAHGNSGKGFPVGRADADGQFLVRDVNNQRELSARAAGYAPSDQIYSKGTAGGEVEMDLILRGESGSIVGVVRSPDGVPLVGARVQITGEVPGGWQAPEDGRWRSERPLPFALRSDEQGGFATDQVGAGSVLVQVRAETLAPWTQRLWIGAGESLELDVTLERGATLRGTVSHADGTPAEGANVRIGSYGSFASFRGRCDESGGYLIHGLPEGTHEVSASKRDRGKAEGSLAVELGVANRWDVTLNEGTTVRGLVVDSAGEPLVNWMVGHTNGRGLWGSSARTDVRGEFVLSDLPSSARDLAVGPPNAYRVGVALFVPDALPTTDALRIVVPDDRQPGASLELLVTVDGKVAPPDTRVVLRAERPFMFRELHPDESGAVQVEQLLAGEFRVEVNLPNRAVQRRKVVLGPGEHLDLGEVELSVGGRLALELAGVPYEHYLQVNLIDSEGEMLDFFDPQAGDLSFGPIAPGEVQLRLSGGGVASQVFRATVIEGETRVCRLELRPGCSRTVRIFSEGGKAIPSSVVFKLFDDSGELVQRYGNFAHGPAGASETRLGLGGLEIGSYTAVVESFDGRRGSAQLVVSSLEDVPGVALELELR